MLLPSHGKHPERVNPEPAGAAGCQQVLLQQQLHFRLYILHSCRQRPTMSGVFNSMACRKTVTLGATTWIACLLGFAAMLDLQL